MFAKNFFDVFYRTFKDFFFLETIRQEILFLKMNMAPLAILLRKKSERHSNVFRWKSKLQILIF